MRDTEKYNEELTYIKNFINDTTDGFSTQDLYWQQLQALWTAFCMHQDLMPDTAVYDSVIHELYEEISYQLKRANKDIKNTKFPYFERFDIYMGSLLS